MFPLPIITYVKIGLFTLAVLLSGYIGYSIEASRFERYKVQQLAETQKAQELHQAATDQIRIQKDAKIASINSQLVDAIGQLRSRPDRTQGAPNGQGGTGLSLYASDAEFLTREAARADVLREALDACYKQYDALK